MTDLLSRLVPRARPRVERAGWLLVTGAGAALAAVGSVLLALAAVTVLLWASAPHADRALLEAVRAAGLVWLLAHRVTTDTAAGELTLAPLMITTVTGFAAIRAGGWAARSAGVTNVRSVAVTMAGFAIAYGILAGTVAAMAGGTTFQPKLLHAVGAGFLFAGVAGALGGAWSTGLVDRLAIRLPSGSWPAVRAGAAGVLTLGGGGALVTAVSLGVHPERASQLFAAVSGGWAGALGVLAVCVAYLPNAALWAASFATGPGFAVGHGTEVALGGVQLGAAPALPLLAALPGSGAAPLPSYAALAVPALAGVVTGLVAERHSRAMSVTHSALCAVAAAGVAGAAFGLLAWLSGGSAGGRLSPLGPSGWLAGLAVAGELTILAPLVLLVARWWTRHSRR